MEHLACKHAEPSVPWGAAAQVNLEFMTVDRRSFVTGEAHALRALFGEGGSGSASYRVAVASICARLAGLFASLKVRAPLHTRCAMTHVHTHAGGAVQLHALSAGGAYIQIMVICSGHFLAVVPSPRHYSRGTELVLRRVLFLSKWETRALRVLSCLGIAGSTARTLPKPFTNL